MSDFNKKVFTMEFHSLQLPYASLRIHKKNFLHKMEQSIQQYGQIAPVITVQIKENQWVLVDGYLRVEALKRIKSDVVKAEEWNCDLQQALVSVLRDLQHRPWEAIEEALLLRELKSLKMSQSQMAERLGRDQSWVSRRLALLDSL